MWSSLPLSAGVPAAVEELENPELRTKPLVVGGDPHGRGVVATANYQARTFGIYSAMSCAEALRRCPHAVFVRPRHSLYREYSQDVWETVPDGRRIGKRDARTAWASALTRAEPAVIVDGMRRYAHEVHGKETRCRTTPAPWRRADRWTFLRG